MKHFSNAVGFILRWCVEKPTWIVVFTASSAVLSSVVVLMAIWIGIQIVLSPYPIHLHYPTCNDGRVSFSPTLSNRYHAQMRRYVENWDTAYAVIGNKIYTAANTDFEDNIDKQIRTLADPDKQGQRTLGPRDHMTHQLFRIWQEMEKGTEKRIAWCHVVESVVSPKGVDAEARRQYPSIWPPETWHVPTT